MVKRSVAVIVTVVAILATPHTASANVVCGAQWEQMEGWYAFIFT